MTTISIVLHPQSGSITPDGIESLERIVDSLRHAVEANGCTVISSHLIGVSHPAGLRGCLTADATLLYTLPAHECTVVARGTFEKAFRACRDTAHRVTFPIRAMGCAGQDLVESALVTALVALIAVAAFYPLAQGLMATLSRMFALLQPDAF